MVRITQRKFRYIFNEPIKMGKFPDNVKKTEVTPVYKKGNINDKQSCCSVSA